MNIKKLAHKLWQTIYEKYILGAKVELIIAHNHQVTSISQESVQDLSANMSVEHILFSAEKSKYFIGLYPKNSEHYMSGSVKFKIYSRTKKSTKSYLLPCYASEEVLICIRYLQLQSCISKIFATWIMYLFYYFKDYRFAIFPDRDEMKEYTPQLFKKLRNIKASVDCVKIRCQVPRDYAQQRKYLFFI